MCQERKELEQLIFTCVRAMSYHSMSASKLALNPGVSRPADFEVLRREYEAASARLRVLCECLRIHEKSHGCVSKASRSWDAVMHAFEGWDHLQRRIPGAKFRLHRQSGGAFRALEFHLHTQEMASADRSAEPGGGGLPGEICASTETVEIGEREGDES